MADKTYTLTELVNNLRKAVDDGIIPMNEEVAYGLACALGYPLTEEGYTEFDADLTRLGL